MRAQILKVNILVPIALGLIALVALAIWMGSGPGKPLAIRVPGTDQAPGADLGSRGNAILAGKLVNSNGKPAAGSGTWPQFRGPDRDGISKASNQLARSWEP